MREGLLKVGLEVVAFDQSAAAGGEGKGQRGAGSFRRAAESGRDPLGVMDPAATNVCLSKVGSPRKISRIREARLLGERLNLRELGDGLLRAADSEFEEPKRRPAQFTTMIEPTS